MTTLQLPASFEHQAAIVNGVNLHYVLGGREPRTAPLMLLIHGFPQNWWCWHRVLAGLGERYTVIAPDLRGVGLSDKPAGGYTKRELAADLHALVESLQAGPAHLVGHDIGGMVAYAYATQHPARSLTVMDVTIPGIGDWDQVVSDPHVWHFAFHQKRDLPEALIVGGREHAYISSFINHQAFRRGAIAPQDMTEYVDAYRHPGAFRCAMEMYRQFPQDVVDNRNAGPLPADLPVLGMGGEKRWAERVGQRLAAVSANVKTVSVPGSGHFIAEEQPEYFIDAMFQFCG
ncbi:alpha/beta fold hydrolase [Cupriavidus gilardii]|uniref:alpha/beta fold hydrolase n=1 Tax=Cupriavidus gilardii TaxID=82541 RepID=UPI0021C11A2D|nr:alpha/beta hydrolase [Cupriavidus gilardii]MCT9126081.1 alpha/beta hydrolase [Cupriavidus gilardii]